MQQADTSDIEALRRSVGRAGFIVAVTGLVTGVVLFALGHLTASTRAFQLTIGVLLAMPVKNVVAVMADEVRRRDWWFGLLAVAVLAELAFSVLDRLR
jgi:Kef-type K+ transport system membrane component KefB